MTQLSKVAPPGEVLGIGRKESIYDTEGQNDAVVTIAEIECFVDFGSFRTPLLSMSKRFGRDTNLRGGNSFLPTGYKFGAYRWRCSVHRLSLVLTTVNLGTTTEEQDRYRELSSAELTQDRTPYIMAQLQDLVSWRDNRRVTIALDAAAAPLTAFAITPGTDHEGRALDVKGQPWVLEALQSFRAVTKTPDSMTPTALNELYITHTLDGVLVRPAN